MIYLFSVLCILQLSINTKWLLTTGVWIITLQQIVIQLSDGVGVLNFLCCLELSNLACPPTHSYVIKFKNFVEPLGVPRVRHTISQEDQATQTTFLIQQKSSFECSRTSQNWTNLWTRGLRCWFTPPTGPVMSTSWLWIYWINYEWNMLTFSINNYDEFCRCWSNGQLMASWSYLIFLLC